MKVHSKVNDDNGTNFSSQLTQELLRRLGCSPVFAMPGQPQASGLVERFNKTCKDMLFHVIQQHGRLWHRVILLAVWTLREVPNATTKVSPYMLVYRRLPSGPLAVLKESWTDQRNVSADLGKPVESYTTDLRARLKKAADWAELHARYRSLRSASLYAQPQPASQRQAIRRGRQGDRSRRRRGRQAV